MKTKADPFARAMTEAELLGECVLLAHQFDWLAFHALPAQVREGGWVTPYQGDKGYPDLTLSRRGSIIIAELKKLGEKPSPAQRGWLSEMSGDTAWAQGDCAEPVVHCLGPLAGQQKNGFFAVAVWTPAQLRSGEIERLLR